MNKYFRLHEECFFVPDRDGSGAIYNVFSGDIFKVSENEAKIIMLLENNESIDKIPDKIPNVTETFLIDRLNTYKENEIGTFYDRPVYINKLMIDYKAMQSIPTTSSIILTRAIISLSNVCHQKCKFCYPAQYIGDNTCICCSGLEKNIQQQYMEIERLRKIIVSITKLKCENVVIKIPDIEVKSEYFLKCLDIIMEYSFLSSTVILGNPCSKSILFNLLQYNINLIIQKEIKDAKDIRHTIKLYNELISMKNHKKISLHFIVYDEELKSGLLAELQNINRREINCVISMYVQKDEVALNYLDKFKFLKRTSIESFSFNQYYNSCLGGLIYFDQNGDVYPCPNLLDFKFGNIDDFKQVWNEEGLHKFWHETSIDNIKKCRTCSVRYACNNCRANEYILGGNILEEITCSKK